MLNGERVFNPVRKKLSKFNLPPSRCADIAERRYRPMKQLKSMTIRIILLGLAFCVAAVSLIQADPSDDFSLTLAHGPETDAYRVLPESRVTQILRDRLDLFPRSQTQRLAAHLLRLCNNYRFDPAFILALIDVESRFKVKAVSPAGAVGLMQVMPATATIVTREMGLQLPFARIGSPRLLTDPFLNLSVGVAYLAWLRDHYRGMPPYYLVAAYNVGPSRLDELIERGDFKPVQTKKYYDAVRKSIPSFRFYGHDSGLRASGSSTNI
jgi:hypothetical protein